MVGTGTVTNQAFYDMNDITILKTTLTELSTNTENNTTMINVKVELIGNSNTNNAWSDFKQDLTITVGDRVRTSSINGYNLAYGVSRTLYNVNWTINRDPNSAGIFTVGTSLTDAAATSGTQWPVAKASYTTKIQMSEINAASTPSINVQSEYIGNAITIQTNRKSSLNVHNIDYVKPDGTLVNIARNVGESRSWTIPITIASFMTDSTSYSLTIQVTTFKDGVQIQQPQRTTLTVEIPPGDSLFLPSVTKPTYVDKASFFSKINVHLKNRSRFEFTSVASGKQGATITSTTLVYKNKTTSAITRVPSNISGSTIKSSGFSINGTGSYDVYFEVVDSRGLLVNSQVTTINLLDYTAPVLSNTLANRNDETKTTIEVSALGSGSSISGKNTLTLSIKMRISGQDIEWGALSDIDTITSTTGNVTLNRNLTNANEASGYDIQFTLKDTVGSVSTSVLQVSSASVLLDAYKDVGVAIGKMYEPSHGGSLQTGEDGLIAFGPIKYKDENVMYVQRDSIPDGADLNTLTESGIYTKTTRNTNNPVKNLPSGFLESNIVINTIKLNDTATIQYAMNVPASVPTIINPMKISVRSKYYNFWNPWQTIV